MQFISVGEKQRHFNRYLSGLRMVMLEAPDYVNKEKYADLFKALEDLEKIDFENSPDKNDNVIVGKPLDKSQPKLTVEEIAKMLNIYTGNEDLKYEISNDVMDKEYLKDEKQRMVNNLLRYQGVLANIEDVDFLIFSLKDGREDKECPIFFVYLTEGYFSLYCIFRRTDFLVEPTTNADFMQALKKVAHYCGHSFVC